MFCSRGLNRAVHPLLFALPLLIVGCSDEKADKPENSVRHGSTTPRTIVRNAAPNAVRGERRSVTRDRVLTGSATAIDNQVTSSSDIVVDGLSVFPDGEAASSTTIRLAKIPMSMSADWLVGVLPADDVVSTITEDAGTFRLTVSGQLSGHPLLLEAERMGSARTVSAIVQGLTPGNTLHRTITMRPAASVTGCVVDETSRPIAGVSIRAVSQVFSDANVNKPLYHDETVSGADGSFTLDELTTDVVTVTCVAERYGAARCVITPPASDLTVVMKESFNRVRGRVLDQISSAGIAGASITLSSDGHRDDPLSGKRPRLATTDALGEFEISGISDGNYRLTASAGDKRMTTESGGSRGLLLEFAEANTTEVVVTLYPGHTIRGVVRDRALEAPIKNATVTVDERSTLTDASGRFELCHVFGDDRGIAMIAASKAGYTIAHGWEGATPPATIVDLRVDEPDTSVTLELVGVVAVSGTVKTADGSAVAGAVVTGCSSDPSVGMRESARTDESGHYEFKTKAFSRLRVVAQPDHLPATIYPEMLDVADEPMVGIDLIVGSGAGSVSGTVTTADGRPANATVRATRCVDVSGTSCVLSLGTVDADAQGRFTLERLPLGSVELRALGSEYTGSDPVAADLKPGVETKGVQLVLGRPVDSPI